MSNSKAPMNIQKQSISQRILQFWQMVIAPHPSVTDISVQGRGQLLNAITLILSLSFVIGLIARPSTVVAFDFMLAVSICSFLLGKSKYPKIGSLLFSIGFLSTSYLSLYFGFARDYSTSILAIVPIALIVASVLVSQRSFAGLVVYAALSTFLASLYSKTPINSTDVMRTGGIISSVGIVLYGINVFRANLENSRTKEINETNQNLQIIKDSLEKRVQEHSQELDSVHQQMEAKAKRLRTISDISQKISANVNMPANEMLTSIVEIVSEKLGFYHVGIFMLDKNREYAELRAANSEGGQRMLERRHQLKVGGAGIVGYVSQSGYPRIALSTGADAVFFNNPDLPNTRSEMAIPLKIGNLVVGVLDVQSSLPAAFSEEDTNAFNTLATQIALAIKYTQMDELPTTQFARKVERLTTVGKQKGYTYSADGTIMSAKAINSPVLGKALQAGETIAQPATISVPTPTLAIPVKIRDNVIGYIHVEAAEAARKWTEDEIAMAEAVSDRAALALENARLFEESERRAEQEQLMAQVTSRIGSSINFERILQTTIQEIGQTLKARRTYIQMESVSSDAKDAAERGGQA